MPYKILFKYPSRGRPQNFFKGLDSIVNNLYDRENFHISCTLDTDDKSMNNESVIERIKEYPNTSIAWGTSISKVDAVNRSMPDYDFDIICVHSDDMLWQFFGFDAILRIEAEKGGLDKLYHIPDNDAKEALATMYIAGKYLYKYFGWIYNPVYKSLFCDTELQEVVQRLGKYVFIPCPGMLFHANAAYGHQKKDAMFIEQQEIGYTVDQETYNKRKLLNFGMDNPPFSFNWETKEGLP